MPQSISTRIGKLFVVALALAVTSTAFASPICIQAAAKYQAEAGRTNPSHQVKYQVAATKLLALQAIALPLYATSLKINPHTACSDAHESMAKVWYATQCLRDVTISGLTTRPMHTAIKNAAHEKLNKISAFFRATGLGEACSMEPVKWTKLVKEYNFK